MAQNMSLFSEETKNDFILSFSYEGPSFDNQMEITKLNEEIAGLKNCLEIIIHVLGQNKKIDFNLGTIDIFVSSFAPGSFKKKIKFLSRTVEKHPVKVGLVGNILVGILTVVPNFSSKQIIEMSPETVGLIGDVVKIQLLKNPDFTTSLAKLANPLVENKDKLVLTESLSNSVVIDYEQRLKLNQLADLNKDLEEKEVLVKEVLYGRITRIDVDATKNNLGFKINGYGTTIPCSLDPQIPLQEIGENLGRWFSVDAVVSKRGNKRLNLFIEKITTSSPPVNYKQSQINGENE